jgi:serine/threonine protein kinase/tetratricopeptide (TPR) repeat protein
VTTLPDGPPRKLAPSVTPNSTEDLTDVVRIISNRFRLGRRLGEGGMGEVYEAEDTVLQRKVALKSVVPKLRDNPDYRQRLLKEARRASSLNHPKIAQIYDIVEEGNESFLVMEYVAGDSLRHRMACAWDNRSVLRVATQCAEALDAAHRHHILHGDIKPENIMLTPEGNVKLLDFGLAKNLPLGAINDAKTLESAGSSFDGTPAYMAPEALRGSVPDACADIFSLGVVLYELLKGANPFRGNTLAETIDRILHLQPDPMPNTTSREAQKLQAIVQRMLAKEPRQRYANGGELLNDLQSSADKAARGPTVRPKSIIRAVSGTIISTILVVWSVSSGSDGLRKAREFLVGPHVPDKITLAILPVAVEGNDPETTAFASGLIDTLTGRLGQLTEQRSLGVIPASEIADKKVDSIEKAWQEFGANVVLRVNIHRSGDMLRVSPVLLDARTHRQLRARVITDSMSNPFALEDRVGDVVIQELGLALGPQETQVLQLKGTDKEGAYQFYLQGVGYLRQIEKTENIDSAITLFQRALQNDTGFGMAYAGLGQAYWAKYEQLRENKWLREAIDMCKRAAAAGNAGADGDVCLGMLFNGQGKYEDALHHYQEALEIDNANEAAYAGLAGAYESLGRQAEAEGTLRRLLQMPPSARNGYNLLGGFYHRQGRDQEAAQMFKNYISLAPDAFVGYYNLGASLISLGHYAEAIEELNRSIEIRPTAEAYTNLGTAYFDLGQGDLAISAFEHSVKLDDRRYDYWGNLGDAYYWTPGRQHQAPQAYKMAIALAEDILKNNPHDGSTALYTAQYYAMLGDRPRATRYLLQGRREVGQSAEFKFNEAIVFAQLDDRDRALEALQEALAAGYPATQIDVTPTFGKFRLDPGFRDLRKRYIEEKGKPNESNEHSSHRNPRNSYGIAFRISGHNLG